MAPFNEYFVFRFFSVFNEGRDLEVGDVVRRRSAQVLDEAEPQRGRKENGKPEKEDLLNLVSVDSLSSDSIELNKRSFYLNLVQFWRNVSFTIGLTRSLVLAKRLLA